MRRKILTLLLVGLCASFLILSSVVIYFRSAMQDDLFRLGENFSEKTSEYVWSQTRKQTMKAVEQLTVAHAAQMDSEMEEIKEDAELLSRTITRIISNPNDYMPRDFSELISRKNTSNISFILLSEEISYNRSRELNEEIALATNIEDLLIDIQLSYESNNNSCYVASKNGYFICVDTFGETKTNEPFDARQRSWYKEAQQADKITFSKIFIDEDGDKAITCAAPYYNGNEFAGVVGIGCDITTWYNLLVKTVVSEGRTCFILDEEGVINVSHAATGKITAVYIKTGDTVKAGQLIASMEQPERVADTQMAQYGAGLASSDRDVIARVYQYDAKLHQQSASENIYAECDGVVDQVLIEKGSIIQAGNPICTIRLCCS